jgi:hypothetical protein
MVRRFLKNLSRGSQEPYQVTKLLNGKIREDMEGQPLHFVCDIDKTYLETDFETAFSIAKIAFEQATDKVTVAGATDVLLLARWGDIVQGQRICFGESEIAGEKHPLPEVRPRCLHFVSSSPPQLRLVLEEKLSLDGLDWTSDTFKDQVYNIKMGRMDLLRQHVAYKSLAILSLVEKADPGSRFILIGDNAESDVFIYWGIKLLLDEKISVQGYLDFVAKSGVEPELLGDLRQFLAHACRLVDLPLSQKKRVESIYIRRVPGSEDLPEKIRLGGVNTFHSFFQVGLAFMCRGWVSLKALKPLIRAFHNQYGVDLKVLEKEAISVLCQWPPKGSANHQILEDQLKIVWKELTGSSISDQRLRVCRDQVEPQEFTDERQILDVADKLIQWIHHRRSLKT